MALVAIELLPLQSAWEECPAGGRVAAGIALSDLSPLNLGWREHWTEAFLAAQPHSILTCLDEPLDSIMAWRQLADIDIVYLNPDGGSAILVELKKQRGSNAKDAICQLARNLSNARRVLAPHNLKTIRTVACGEWGAGQIARAKATVAWHYLETEGTAPSFAVHSGAADRDGRRYFVLQRDASPFPKKGRREIPHWFRELQCVARELSGMFPAGLRLDLYRVDSLVVFRCTGDSRVRDHYLGSRLEAPPSPAITSFLAIERWLAERGFKTRRVLGQRLECRVLLDALDMENVSHRGQLRQLLFDAAQAGRTGPSRAD